MEAMEDYMVHLEDEVEAKVSLHGTGNRLRHNGYEANQSARSTGLQLITYHDCELTQHSTQAHS